MLDELTHQLHSALEDALTATEALIDYSDWEDRPDVASDLSNLRRRIVDGAERYSMGIPKRTISSSKQAAMRLFNEAQEATYLIHVENQHDGWRWAIYDREDGLMLRTEPQSGFAWSALANALDFLTDYGSVRDTRLICPSSVVVYVEGIDA
jgi:hypothetical protein